MCKIGDLLKENRFGQLEFLCPGCHTPCNYDAPCTMNRWECANCRLVLVYPQRTFLEVLAKYAKEKAQ